MGRNDSSGKTLSDRGHSFNNSNQLSRRSGRKVALSEGFTSCLLDRRSGGALELLLCKSQTLTIYITGTFTA